MLFSVLMFDVAFEVWVHVEVVVAFAVTGDVGCRCFGWRGF